MEKATVSKLKDNLSAYLRKVRAGQSVVIYDRDLPIARLERIESAVDVIAVEVERIAESQRFAVRLAVERDSGRAIAPPQGGGGKTITPH